MAKFYQHLLRHQVPGVACVESILIHNKALITGCLYVNETRFEREMKEPFVYKSIALNGDISVSLSNVMCIARKVGGTKASWLIMLSDRYDGTTVTPIWSLPEWWMIRDDKPSRQFDYQLMFANEFHRAIKGFFALAMTPPEPVKIRAEKAQK